MGEGRVIHYPQKRIIELYVIYETRNTVYVCPLKYMSIWPYRNVGIEYKGELNHRANNSDSMLDQIIAAIAKLSLEIANKKQEAFMEQMITSDVEWDAELEKMSTGFSDDEMLNRIRKLQELGQLEIEEMNQRENNRLVEMARQYDDCVYIEVSNVGSGSLLAYHLGDFTGVVHPSFHSGMFQDSVLYMKYPKEDDPCSLDFRYFPKGWEDIMETYSWSDNINQVVIKNETGRVLKFNHVDILTGEIAVFEPDTHCQGLISPDCYNGKSAFSTPDDMKKFKDL